MTFASRTTSAIVEACRVFDRVGGLALHDTYRCPDRLPGCDHFAMSLGSRAFRGSNDGTALAIGKLGELAHQLCVLLGAVRGRGQAGSIAPEGRAGKSGLRSRSGDHANRNSGEIRRPRV